MRILYYTPLKAPAHRVPSGDRAMARALRQVLRSAGHRVQTLAAERSGVVLPRPEQQAAERGRTRARYDALLRAAPAAARSDLWLTYHVYYKKPDWIGAEAARRAGIPYVLAEVSYAPKRAGDPWDLGHRQVAKSIAAADLVLNFNPIDANCVRPLMKRGAALLDVPPFIDTRPFAAAARQRARHRRALGRRCNLPQGVPWLICVAMMRPGDKQRSYDILGRALGRLLNRRWRLLVVGDGPAQAEVKKALAGVRRRVVYLGQQPPERLAALYAAADLYVWPAINEAWGMTLIEAQAAGLPVVAGRTGGVPNVVREGQTGLLPPVGDWAAFADAVAALLDDGERRTAMAQAAQPYAMERHDRRAAGRLIDAALRRLVEKRR